MYLILSIVRKSKPIDAEHRTTLSLKKSNVENMKKTLVGFAIMIFNHFNFTTQK